MRFIYAYFCLEFLKQALSNLFLDGIYISQNFHFLVICYHHIHLYMIYFYWSKFYVYFQRLFQIFQLTSYLATASPLSLNPRAPLYNLCVNFLTLSFRYKYVWESSFSVCILYTNLFSLPSLLFVLRNRLFPKSNIASAMVSASGHYWR